MNSIQKRFVLFLGGCIPFRIFLVYLALTLSKSYLKIMGYLALIPAMVFLYLYLTDSRKIGRETFGKPIWWNHLRPVHSALYFLFAITSIKGEFFSWIFLLIDVFVGFISFLLYHYQEKHYLQLL